MIDPKTHFFEMQNGEINPTELVAAIIDQKETLLMVLNMRRRLSTVR